MTVPLSFKEILDGVRRIAPVVRERAPEIELARRIPDELVAQLRECGVFRAAMPAEWGGPELTSMEQIEVVEELAKADASVAWCAATGMDSGIYAGYLDQAAAREMFPRLDMVTAGWIPPKGKAHAVDGGYRVEGHWRFGSGFAHADWIVGGCLVLRDGQVARDALGRPEWRVVMARPDRFTMLDTWHSTGLAGTGSCDYTADGLFVPAAHTFSFDFPLRNGLLQRRSDTIIRKMSGIPLGTARSAIDHVRELAATQVDHFDNVPWRESRHVQSVVARCELRLAAARALVYSSVEAQWRRVTADESMTHEERAMAALARYNAFRSAREIVADLYDLVGGSAVYAGKSPLDRQLRDMITACQHVVGQDRVLEWSGQLLLGDEPRTLFI